MLRISIEMAAAGRCLNRFCGSKRGLPFSIFHSPLNSTPALTLPDFFHFIQRFRDRQILPVLDVSMITLEKSAVW